MSNKLNSLGLCARARKIVSGEELVISSIRKGKAKIVFLANDAGPNTTKNIKDKALYYNVIVDDSFSSIELNQAIGTTNRMAIAIEDEGFAKILKK